ncbi:MAG: bifunctional aspartate kinase/homoserine dehydrogenase I [Bacteroidota bacterium]
MKVLKFGGSSVANAKRIAHVADIIAHAATGPEKPMVIVSAMGGMTNLLIEMSEIAAAGSEAYKPKLAQFSIKHMQVVDELIDGEDKFPEIRQEIIDGQVELGNLLQGLFLTRDLTPRTLDYIKSFGERSCAFMIAGVMKARGLDSTYINARELIKTNDTYGNAKIYIDETYQNIRKFRQEHPDQIGIVTGFIASTRDGITTTLGRGGSDYTASIFGSALAADEIQIWTDVDGVMTADPRNVKQAFPVPSMSYEEALEMSHFGARVIYPPTIIPALEKKIPIRIKNTFNPEAVGTLISDDPEPYDTIVKGIASIGDISLLTLEGSGLFGASSTAARLFNVLANKHVNAILITQGSSEHTLSFAIRPEDGEIAKAAIEEEFALEIQAKLIEPVRVEKDLAVIAAIGDNMKSRPGISGKLFQALGKNGVNVIATAQGSSERNISVVICKEDEAKALTAIHDVFFLSDYYVLNLFVVGVGLIGSTLLDQIKKQREQLIKHQFVELRVVALSNSKKMVFQPEGIDLENWKEVLSAGEKVADLEGFADEMIALNLPNSVFVDNTALDNIRTLYPRILSASISISTPNKVAVSSQYTDYLLLKKLADQHSVKFFYEANVGAGLPVLTTLSDLITSGDRILKIEGVLSGSLSFIFNTFGPGVSFSEVVTEAGEKGFTEPDPRIDLSGKDVARKLLILARESGYKMEMEEIEVENILPEACLSAPDVPAFMTELAKADDHFEALRKEAADQGKVLRFIATLEGDKAYIKLQKLDESNPFFNLSGSDNMIVFTTERYHERPLVIKGPGAGAEVTAAGVFAEILRVGYYLS